METVGFIGVGRARYRFGLLRAIWRQQLADVQRQVSGGSMLKTFAFCGTMLGLGAVLFASELEAADDEIIAPTRIENVQVRDGVNIAVAVYLPKGDRPLSDAVRRLALSLRQQPAAADAAVPVARDRARQMVSRSRLCLRAHGRAWHRPLRGRVPVPRQQGAERLLRRDRVGGAAALVGR